MRERLRQPLGSPRTMGRPGARSPMLHFEDRIDVTVPPLDFVRLRAEWTRHWNLSGRERAAPGAPTRSELRERSRYLSELSGAPRSQSVPLSTLLIAAGKAVGKGLTRRQMPPADPRPAPKPKHTPLKVVAGEDSTPTPTPTPTATPTPRPRM